MEPYEDDVAVEHVKLDRLKAVMLMELPPEMAKELANEPRIDVSTQWDFIKDSVMLRIRMDILGREMDRIECRWPADWWQAFKQRWFPAWALRRWPVQEEVRQLVARELYPKVKLPDWEPVIALKVE